MPSLSIKNLVKRTTDIQQMMTLAEVKAGSKSPTAYHYLFSTVSQKVKQGTIQVEQLFQESRKSAADLPIRTRRAYQWIKFLAEDKQLNRHLEAIQRINTLLQDIPYPRRIKPVQVEFSFYHIGHLYKVQEREKTRAIIAQESFIHAPDQVLISLLRAGLEPSSGTGRFIIRNYTFTEQYQKTRKHLEYLAVPKGSFAHGKIHDLDRSFHRVNQKYFQSSMNKPNLVWNSRMTHRKFGHYQADTNTIMVSISLDHPRIPAFVVDYVMYHELLHKQLGARQVNNRRYIHTQEFKRKETQFSRIAEAQRILSKITRK